MSSKAISPKASSKSNVCDSEDGKEITSLLGKRKHRESTDESHTANDESEEGSKGLRKEKR